MCLNRVDECFECSACKPVWPQAAAASWEDLVPLSLPAGLQLKPRNPCDAAAFLTMSEMCKLEAQSMNL